MGSLTWTEHSREKSSLFLVFDLIIPLLQSRSRGKFFFKRKYYCVSGCPPEEPPIPAHSYAV